MYILGCRERRKKFRNNVNNNYGKPRNNFPNSINEYNLILRMHTHTRTPTDTHTHMYVVWVCVCLCVCVCVFMCFFCACVCPDTRVPITRFITWYVRKSRGSMCIFIDMHLHVLCSNSFDFRWRKRLVEIKLYLLGFSLVQLKVYHYSEPSEDLFSTRRVTLVQNSRLDCWLLWSSPLLSFTKWGYCPFWAQFCC